MDKVKNRIIELTLDEIKPYENNPRDNDKAVAAVMKSIKEFGYQSPIVVDKDHVIICGHTRYKALKRLNFTSVDVIVADSLTDEQIKAYRLADNKVGEIATWDSDLLLGELSGILDIDMTAFGFDLLEPEEEAKDDDFEIVVPEEPKSKRGDIYRLGRHRLMCGDSTSGGDIESLMGGQLADLLITDPPYNVNYEGKTKDALKIQNDQMGDGEFRQLLRDAFTAADMVMKPGAVFYIWHAESEGYNFRGACFDTGWKVRECLIWVKNNMVLGRQDYQWKHEPCLYGWKDGAGHLWASDRKQTTVLEFDRPTKSKEHPTMKPIPLFDYQIKNNTKGGDLVLDLFGGSGTTLMACEQNGRNACLMELDPKYVDVIINRWEAFTGMKAELINNTETSE